MILEAWSRRGKTFTSPHMCMWRYAATPGTTNQGNEYWLARESDRLGIKHRST